MSFSAACLPLVRALRWVPWVRWWFGLLWNPVFPTLPLGTLAANLVGATWMDW